ncbi:MAG: sulfotransferase family protein, partial [Thermoplasmata archaeon]
MLAPETLIDAAVDETGLDDFGGDSFREPLARLTTALEEEAALTELGSQILEARLEGLLASRLRIEDVYSAHPEIDEELVEGPIFIIGLPRTGTTALSQLLANDPQIRSLRLWESSAPVPPPEESSQHTDSRIAAAEQGLEAMYEAFPRMKSLYFQTATGPTECQDLLGMEFRTSHFDGMARVPSYVRWVLDCDMSPAYKYHHRALKLLQWHCPPRLWHLKTPVHTLYLDQLAATYPRACFLWTHRDPAEVLGSVCSLMLYTRSWVSDRDDSDDIGAQQAELWAEALRRAIAFRGRAGEGRFADVSFDHLNADPLGALAKAYGQLGLQLSGEASAR